MSKSDIKVHIHAIAHGGDGIARLEDGRIAFVPFTAPGDEALVRIVADKGQYVNARLHKLLVPGPGRQSPPCELYGRCGGCQYQHLDYELQLQWKTRHLLDSLSRLGGESLAAIDELIPSPLTYGYRNKLVLQSSPEGYGFTSIDNRSHLPLRRCHLAQDALNQIIPLLPKADPRSRKTAPKATLRTFSGSGESLVFHGPEAPQAMAPRQEIANGLRLSVRPDAFYQVNHAVGESLQRKVAERVALLRPARVIDAYCGCGFLSLAIRDIPVTGLEQQRQGAEAAQLNARSNQLATHDYRHCDVEKGLQELLAADGDRSLLILDPPRTGCSPAVLQMICERPPAHIIYVSCEAATLGRDLKELLPHYAISHSILLDMFPQTAHFETLLELHRR